MLIEVPIQTIKSDCPMIFFNDRTIFDLTEDRQLPLAFILIEMTLLIGSNPIRDRPFSSTKNDREFLSWCESSPSSECSKISSIISIGHSMFILV